MTFKSNAKKVVGNTHDYARTRSYRHKLHNLATEEGSKEIKQYLNNTQQTKETHNYA